MINPPRKEGTAMIGRILFDSISKKTRNNKTDYTKIMPRAKHTFQGTMRSVRSMRGGFIFRNRTKTTYRDVRITQQAQLGKAPLFYAFYAFYAWWDYFPQSGALAEGTSLCDSCSKGTVNLNSVWRCRCLCMALPVPSIYLRFQSFSWSPVSLRCNRVPTASQTAAVEIR
jgi:hypothetical protein